MQYIIKANRLKDIIKQYNIDIYSDFSEDPQFEEISEIISSMDIFENENSDNRLNRIRKIAYLAMNQEYQQIQLQLIGTSISFTDNDSVIAALYNTNENNNNIMIQGNINNELMELLLPVTDNSSLSKEYIKTNFNWNSLDNISQNIWSDKEYIIEHFYDYQWEDIVKMADKKLWDDEDFFERINGLDILIEHLPASIKYNESVFKVLRKDTQLLGKMFNLHYLPLFTQSTYENPIMQLEQQNEIEYSDEKNEIIVKAKKLKKMLDTLIEDKDVVINLLKHTKSYKLYKVCNDEIKYNENVVKTLFHFDSYSNVEDYLPKDIFQNENILVEYLSTKFSRCKNIKHYNFIYQDWIKDKEKLLKYVSLVPLSYPHPFDDLFTLLPKVLKNDKDVISFFISKNYHLYEQLSEPFRMSKKLLLTYVENGRKNVNARFVPTYALQYLDKKEKMFVLENMPHFILKNDFPEELKNDLSMISCCGKVFSQLSLSKEQIECLSKDTEKAIKLIEADTDNLALLTDSARKNPEIAFTFININKDKQYELKKHEQLIHKNVWCSRKLCLDLIKSLNHNNPILQKIPQGFWNDIEFIREIAQEVDKKKTNINVFNNGPSIINELISLHKMKEGNIEQSLMKLISQSILQNTLQNKLPVKTDKTKTYKI